MNLFYALAAAIAAALVIYLVARLITAAYFRSKQDYDNQRMKKS